MFTTTLFLTALAASSAIAIQVTSPNQFTVWDPSSSSQTVSWTSVNTDASSFAIVLVNQDRSILPTNDQLLSANVSTSAGTTSVTYPGGGAWPTGPGFQVNLISSSTDSSAAIYAQSNDFNITASSSSSSSSASSSTTSSSSMSSSSSSTSASMTTVSGSTLTASSSSPTAGTASGSGSAASTTADTLPNASPSAKSAALPITSVHLTGAGMAALVLSLSFVAALL